MPTLLKKCKNNFENLKLKFSYHILNLGRERKLHTHRFEFQIHIEISIFLSYIYILRPQRDKNLQKFKENTIRTERGTYERFFFREIVVFLSIRFVRSSEEKFKISHLFIVLNLFLIQCTCLTEIKDRERYVRTIFFPRNRRFFSLR